MSSGFRLPEQQEVQDTIRFLTWEQFPKVLEQSIRYFAVLPQVGIYRHINSDIKSFKKALLDTNRREFTMSGVGSLIDYDTYGHTIKRPSPQLAGSSCEGNSLCLEPTCFGFTEGVIESNNLLQNMCWDLAMPCLKDMYYSDAQFSRKMMRYFEMFFKQAPAVSQAYQRTRLMQEAIKVVCTDTNYRFSGSVIGGADGQSLPFYIDPVNPTAFPDISTLTANVGGANLMAFMQYVAPRLFSGGGFTGGMEDVKVYGLKQDYYMAKEQTSSVMDHYMDREILRALQGRGMDPGSDRLDSLMGGEFIHDSLFPTFKEVGGTIVPITQEILEPATIAGYVQTGNPEHAMATLRGLLFVPSNWRFNLVEPPKDDFSDLGLGSGLNFRNNTPGVFPVLSSSMFKGNALGEDGKVILGQTVDSDGMVVQSARGLRKRERAIQEAVRTEVLMTYSQLECGAVEGQLNNVGSSVVPQGRADGFKLKSTMYLGTDVRGTAKPVLLLFRTDTPRSAKPIEVCNVEEVTVSQEAGQSIVSCCPGNQIYVVLTYKSDVSSEFTVGDVVAYRTGNSGVTFEAEVTAVSGNVMTIQSTADPAEILPCCTGGDDDYGVRAQVLNVTEATATGSEIIKATYDTDTSSLFLEFLNPLAAGTAADTATITLADGTEIDVVLAADAAGVFAQVTAAGGETCDLANLDCSCLLKATFAYTA